ncbi:glycosyltransferase family 61 protein [Synechocystis sp. B12]|nr:glycosyltransferase family 61 protein [Synechocystis sp. B12]
MVEIFSPFYVYPCFWLVSNLMELDYFYVLGDVLGSEHFHQFILGKEKDGDIWVNCQQLLKTLWTVTGIK